MALPRVYVETTIPSSYHDTRTDPESVERRESTRRWWADAPDRYELLTSEAVLDELEAGPGDRSPAWLALLDGVALLPIDAAVIEVVNAYVQHKLMPADPGGDALHLALASYHRCDLLVTWNCRHLANANKFGHVRAINDRLGLFVPALVTPQQLLGGRDGPAPT